MGKWKSIARMVLAPAMRGDGAANALTNSPTPNCTPPEGTLARIVLQHGTEHNVDSWHVVWYRC